MRNTTIIRTCCMRMMIPAVLINYFLTFVIALVTLEIIVHITIVGPINTLATMWASITTTLLDFVLDGWWYIR